MPVWPVRCWATLNNMQLCLSEDPPIWAESLSYMCCLASPAFVDGTVAVIRVVLPRALLLSTSLLQPLSCAGLTPSMFAFMMMMAVCFPGRLMRPAMLSLVPVLVAVHLLQLPSTHSRLLRKAVSTRSHCLAALHHTEWTACTLMVPCQTLVMMVAKDLFLPRLCCAAADTSPWMARLFNTSTTIQLSWPHPRSQLLASPQSVAGANQVAALQQRLGGSALQGQVLSA